jgi:hypothetical protein
MCTQKLPEIIHGNCGSHHCLSTKLFDCFIGSGREKTSFFDICSNDEFVVLSFFSINGEKYRQSAWELAGFTNRNAELAGGAF